MNTTQLDQIKLSENFIVVDADYLDRVALNLIVTYERVLERRIAPADFSQWAVDVALDGGLRPDGQHHETQVMLLYDSRHPKLSNFVPSDYANELNGQAFADEQLGEFLVNAYSTSKMVNKDEYMLETITTLLDHEEVKRVMIVADSEESEVCQNIAELVARHKKDAQQVTLLSMQAVAGSGLMNENLGYSVTDALGIKSQDFAKS